LSALFLVVSGCLSVCPQFSPPSSVRFRPNLVSMFIDALGSFGSLASPMRPLAAEKLTKNRRFSTLHVLMF
jgi:hypothetical protein